MADTNATGSLPITIQNVTKTYGSVHALNSVDLNIRSGEFMTLLGPSGSGKTTLLMVLAGFTRPDYGSVKFGDTEVIRTPPHKRNVGMVFQNYALFPHMNVQNNVAFPLKLRGVNQADITQRVEAALETVQLGGYGSRGIEQLSGGQRQRVALARAIVFEPRILLMDEPLSALDKKLREHMQIELRHLHEKLGMTTVYVTHDQREALTMSDRIAVINHGRLMQLDEPRALYEKPRNKFIADFIGESVFLPVSIVDGMAHYAGQPLQTEHSIPSDAARVMLMIRPERLVLQSQSESTPGINQFTGQIIESVFQGESTLLNVRLSSGDAISVRHAARGNQGLDKGLGKGLDKGLGIGPGKGDAVTLSLAAADTVLIADDENPNDDIAA